jgi:DNA polymerase elongation subunit (family B)
MTDSNNIFDSEVYQLAIEYKKGEAVTVEYWINTSKLDEDQVATVMKQLSKIENCSVYLFNSEKELLIDFNGTIITVAEKLSSILFDSKLDVDYIKHRLEKVYGVFMFTNQFVKILHKQEQTYAECN